MSNYLYRTIWIKAKYPSTCDECGEKWRIGHEILFVPSEKKSYCQACGEKYDRPYAKIHKIHIDF